MLAQLRELYARIDALLSGWSCDSSTDCCRFGVTGREPYPSAIELAEMERAVRARGGLPKRRLMPMVDERRCTFLSDEGRCLIYASRPLGCRTFFCERAVGPKAGKELRRELLRAGQDVVALSARFSPGDPGPRPLSRWARSFEGGARGGPGRG